MKKEENIKIRRERNEKIEEIQSIFYAILSFQYQSILFRQLFLSCSQALSCTGGPLKARHQPLPYGDGQRQLGKVLLGSFFMFASLHLMLQLDIGTEGNIPCNTQYSKQILHVTILEPECFDDCVHYSSHNWLTFSFPLFNQIQR